LYIVIEKEIMYIIRKVLKFEAAHVLDSSYSKCCQQIHGHSYLVELYFQAKKLNKDGMVIDFGLVKEVAGELIERFDHAIIVSGLYCDKFTDPTSPSSKVRIVFYNPTAENMARDFYNKIKRKIPKLFKVRVHETTTGWAEYYKSM
jgi:6-pyruvoyltetrahydropterin/6-carboxytetrahydropterin synthase